MIKIAMIFVVGLLVGAAFRLPPASAAASLGIGVRVGILRGTERVRWQWSSIAPVRDRFRRGNR